MVENGNVFMRETTIKLRAIAVVDKNWGIGKDGKLLIHIPGDLKFFKEKTLGNIVIMGRKTLESLPGGKPLDGRITVVISGKLESNDDYYVADSIDSLFGLLGKLIEENPGTVPYVAGGDRIYKQLLPYTDICMITKIDEVFTADKFFENLDEVPEFQLIREGPGISENGVTYKFCEYERIR